MLHDVAMSHAGPQLDADHSGVIDYTEFLAATLESLGAGAGGHGAATIWEIKQPRKEQFCGRFSTGKW